MPVSSRSYAEAVHLLNSLQSNAAVVAAVRSSGGRLNAQSLPELRSYWQTMGYSMPELGALPAIHVAGTKGKGSTSAFSDAVMQSLSFKTGLFTSPHLRHVRERIRINGRPLSEARFTEYFFDVWQRLEREEVKPSYFRFLTLLSFHVFLREKVDVAIVEVGVGGEYDATNILPAPLATGVSTLDLDHTPLLGGDLASIARHKAGIAKASTPLWALAAEPEAWQAMQDVARAKGTELLAVPPISAGWRLGLPGAHQRENAALAVALCRTAFERLRRGESWEAHEADVRAGLAKAFWPGRCQTLRWGERSCVVDGAHTPKSVAACVEWFVESFKGETVDLVFFCTKGRDPLPLLATLVSRLAESGWSVGRVHVAPLSSAHADHTNKNEGEYEKDEQLVATEMALSRLGLDFDVHHKMSSLDEVIRRGRGPVLATGSFYLAGAILHHLDFNMDV